MSPKRSKGLDLGLFSLWVTSQCLGNGMGWDEMEIIRMNHILRDCVCVCVCVCVCICVYRDAN